jgi:hypothetical protein
MRARRRAARSGEVRKKRNIGLSFLSSRTERRRVDPQTAAGSHPFFYEVEKRAAFPPSSRGPTFGGAGA